MSRKKKWQKVDYRFNDTCDAPGCTSTPVGDFNVCAAHLVQYYAERGQQIKGAIDGLLGVLEGLFGGDLGELGPHADHPDPEQPTDVKAEAEAFLRSVGFSPRSSPPTPSEVREFQRHMAKTFHPDSGGHVNPDFMAKINVACDALRKT